ncbi:MAG: hypothetical protein MJ077_03610 [Oscillospiraceae bacterium]|nr:hypothetical protein [Oscillospiraceae bacterium]
MAKNLSSTPENLPAVTLKDGKEAFIMLRTSAAENGVQDMELEEINSEITLSRKNSQ